MFAIRWCLLNLVANLARHPNPDIATMSWLSTWWTLMIMSYNMWWYLDWECHWPNPKSWKRIQRSLCVTRRGQEGHSDTSVVRRVLLRRSIYWPGRRRRGSAAVVEASSAVPLPRTNPAVTAPHQLMIELAPHRPPRRLLNIIISSSLSSVIGWICLEALVTLETEDWQDTVLKSWGLVFSCCTPVNGPDKKESEPFRDFKTSNGFHLPPQLAPSQDLGSGDTREEEKGGD